MRGLVLGGSVVAAAGLVFAFGRTATTPGAGAPAGVEVVSVARRDVGAVVKATGVVKPMIGASVRVGSRVSGVVKHLHVRVGDLVRKGDLLAELDVAERAQQVAVKQAAQARASLEYAETQAGYSTILAPIGGVVASVSTQEGETVAASFAAPTFVTLLDLDRLEVWAYVDETDIGRIERGQATRIAVDPCPDHEFEGTVSDVYPEAEIRDNVVNYVTVVRFAPPRVFRGRARRRRGATASGSASASGSWRPTAARSRWRRAPAVARPSSCACRCRLQRVELARRKPAGAAPLLVQSSPEAAGSRARTETGAGTVSRGAPI